MLNKVSYTSEDIKKCLTDEQKHLLALKSCIDKVEVDTYIEPIVNVINVAINTAIDITNSLPKEYWEARAKLEIGR